MAIEIWVNITTIADPCGCMVGCANSQYRPVEALDTPRTALMYAKWHKMKTQLQHLKAAFTIS